MFDCMPAPEWSKILPDCYVLQIYALRAKSRVGNVSFGMDLATGVQSQTEFTEPAFFISVRYPAVDDVHEITIENPRLAGSPLSVGGNVGEEWGQLRDLFRTRDSR